MRHLDFSSWQTLLSTLFGLALFALVGVGIRLVLLQTVQQRRERENRQINERLRTLIAAYKTLGGSFTGNLSVDPTHLKDLRVQGGAPDVDDERKSSDRSRRIRDAVEGALSDVILLGTEEQVRLATHAARELVSGRPVHTAELVVSLRDFIRGVLDLAPVAPDLAIPPQGPTRPGSGANARGDRKDEARGGGKGGGGGAMGAGGGMGGSIGLVTDDPLAHDEDHHS
ncbi:MAG: hypothetical protein KIT84_03545 [Labilithrix sp.]|nr:hypothetical protein [Labilithrix sp.]MCW5810058.1 hypothetical protein [Labilithrix sp.]